MKNQKLKVGENNKGFSFIEILVVLAAFSALAIVATQIVAVVLTGSKKSESLSSVRANIDYAFNVMERQLHSANSVNCATSTSTQIDYVDEDAVSKNFACIGGAQGYLTYDSERLTSDKIEIDCTQMVFTCNPSSGTTPPSVDIVIEATSSDITGSEGSSITTSTKIILRSF